MRGTRRIYAASIVAVLSAPALEWARKAIPSFQGLNDMLSKEWRERDVQFRNIQMARIILEVRHAGYLEGQKNPSGTDPVPVIGPNKMDGKH